MSRRRIDRGKALVQVLAARSARFLKEALPQLPIGGWAVEKTAQQSLEIERRAADEQDASTPPLDIRRAAGRFSKPPGDSGRFPRLQRVQEMMGYPPAFGRGRLRGTDVHPPVQGHGIHGDYFRAETLRQFHTERALAAARGPRQDQSMAEDIRVHCRQEREQHLSETLP